LTTSRPEAIEPPPLLRAEGLALRYGRHRALDGFSLSLRRGEVTGLLGANGAGKSTALTILAGLRVPDRGRLWLDGHPVAAVGRRLRARTGLLPHRPPLHAELGVQRMLLHAAAVHGVPRRRRAQAADRALERCGLAAVAGRRAGNLSQGYRQRLGLALAIVHGPDIVLLDEPTVGLDPRQLVHLRELIRGLAEEHAVLLSSHALAEVRRSCDRILVLHQGRLADAADAAAAAGGARLLRLEPAPAAAALVSLPGIAAAEALADGYWRVSFEQGGEGEFLAALGRSRWRLQEWSPAAADLERRYLALTAGEGA